MTPDIHPAALELLYQFEGKPRLTARLCEGGRYEVAYGVTYYLDGSPVKAGDRITEDQVMPLTLNALAKEGAPVWKALKPGVLAALKPWQAGALAVMAYNVGGSAAAASSVVRHLNDNHPEDAAASFGLWTGATSAGPTPSEIAAGIVPAFPRSENGRWLSPEGNPCMYFRRFRGLLRRHHATACLSLGYDWREATKNDAISMAVEAAWNPAKSRWEDRILRQTEFAEVLSVARKYPLLPAMAPIPSEPDPPKAPAPVIPVEVEALPEILPEPPLPAPKEKPVTTPAKPVPQPTLPNDFDPNLGVKSMVYSRRFWGWLLVILGRLSFVTDAGAQVAAEPLGDAADALTQAGGLAASLGGAVGGFSNYIAGDPLLLDAYTGFAVMITGEAVRWWGEKKKTKVLV